MFCYRRRKEELEPAAVAWVQAVVERINPNYRKFAK